MVRYAARLVGGGVLLLLDNCERAATFYRESLALAEQVGDQAGLVLGLGQSPRTRSRAALIAQPLPDWGSACGITRPPADLPSPPVEQIAAKRLTASTSAVLG
jgi:hypothetical protein